MADLLHPAQNLAKELVTRASKSTTSRSAPVYITRAALSCKKTVSLGGQTRPVDLHLTKQFSGRASSRRSSRRFQPIPVMSLGISGDVEAQPKLQPSAEILEIWQAADCVCFDVDSTVCVDEGIDELAAFCGAGEAVAAWTTRAMGGSVPFEDALAARLEIFRPSAADLASFLANHPPRLSPGIQELVAKLASKGTVVYLISGGFRQMIEPAAALLGVPGSRVFANRLLFEEDGSYGGFDREEPTSRSGGKAVAIERLKKEHGYEKLVMLGDGATDLEARRPGGADAFIGYGGVQVRPKVAINADWFVYDFKDLIDALDGAQR